MTPKKIIPLPYPIYYWTVFAIGMLGLLDAIYLTISHYRVYTDISYISFCTLSKAINCDTVSQSPYSILFNIPIPVWGLFGYAFFLTILAFARKKPKDGKRIWTFMLWLSLGFSLFSIILAFLSGYYIKSYCLMCIGSYGINFALLYFTWLVRNRYHIKGPFSELFNDLRYLYKYQHRKSLAIIFVFTAVLISYGLFFPHYWQFSPPLLADTIRRSADQTFPPWIGAENPKIVIHEYVDYQCFQCRKNHYLLRALIAKHPDKIKLVHHNFPMDQEVNPLVKRPFHGGAGKLARLAIYAALTKNFWQVNDKLFEIGYHNQVLNTKILARKLALEKKDIVRALLDKNVKYMLMNEIKEGGLKRIIGTPTYLIDDQLYRGNIPPEILEKVIGE